QMAKYVADELFKLVVSEFPLDPKRVGISGHSMGGHGALTLHLRNPNRFKSVSAFAPIVAPLQVPWGRKAFGNYLGDDADLWRRYDACSLVTTRPSHAHILIDQGKDDQFLDEQLRPHLFQKACDETGQTLTLRQHPGYDHSYYFIATLIDDHLRHHAKALG
ncbi:MAG: alpha/beta hydrolase-fold protein, partial [Pseudomonadota bacterium]